MNRRLGLLFGLVGVSCAALTFAACGDDSNSPSSGGPDAAPDHTATTPDATNDSQSTADGTTGDASGDASVEDGGTGEGGEAGEAGQCVPFDAAGLDEASVAAGFQQVFDVYHCYHCHQKASQVVSDAGVGIVLSGNNNGLGDSGTIFPPNLTSDPATGLGCWTDSQIVNAILNGKDNDGKSLCKPMPLYGSPATSSDGGPQTGFPMDAGTAQQIVDFLRSLPVVSNQVPATSCAVVDAGVDAPADAADAGADSPVDTGTDVAMEAAAEAGTDASDQ